MCGIAGFSHTTDVTRRMLPHLLWEMEGRGRDSWGATNGVDILKEVGPVTQSFEKHRKEIFGWNRAIFHTRGASTGDVTITNQHPFVFSAGTPGEPDWKRTVVGIHNGVVVNHNTLNEKYQRNFTCDSMHIYKHLAEDRDMSEIYGWGNLAWYDYDKTHPDGYLRMLRFNQDALEIAKLSTGEIVFCSTSAPIVRAAAMAGSSVALFYSLQNENIYSVEFDNDKPTLYHSQKKMNFGNRYDCSLSNNTNNITSFESNTNRHAGYYKVRMQAQAQKEYLDGICMRMGCTEKVVGGSRKSAVLCADCMRNVMVDASYNRAITESVGV